MAVELKERGLGRQAVADEGVIGLPSVHEGRDSADDLNYGDDRRLDSHWKRVVWYAAAIGRRIGLPWVQLSMLLDSAMLHDVGKMGVSEAILRKPGPLTPDERETVKIHPELGYQMLREVDFPVEALPAVRFHHERYDGTGYPSGLAGEAIPLDARIIAVADAFDAMTSNRPYRPAYSVEQARKEISLCSGSQFDPHVAEAFLQLDARELAELT